jgi:LDH2 family malate/lactate/ureidoglycolate dehydrogenase
MNETSRIEPERRRHFAAAAFETVGMPQADAQLTADTLVQADTDAGWAGAHRRERQGVSEIRDYSGKR